MRADGHTAVMAARAPDQVEGDDAQTALYRALEFFPTPPWAARAGGELIRHVDPEARPIWEPACGQGHMAAPLGESFDVFASDVHPFGFGKVLDFLDEGPRGPLPSPHPLSRTGERGEGPRMPAGGLDGFDWIVTNPPFAIAGQFLKLGLARARRGVALLLRLQFLEGGGRYELLHGAEHPLTACAVFAERVPMTLGRWDPKASTATGYAWFLWMKGAAPRPLIGIPPGTRARLTASGDAARFGWRSEAALLDAMEAAE